jgi:DHA2 family multidrug resistance protein
VAALLDIDKADFSLLRRFDYWGVMLIAVSLGALQYVLEEGSQEDWFSSTTIRTLTAVSVIAGAGAVWRELAAEHPIVELRAFRDGNFVTGCIFSFVLGIGLYGSAFLLPLILSTVRGFNSLQIGTIMMAAGAAQFLSGPIAGFFDQRFDPRIVLGIGLSLFSFGLWLNTTMDAEVGFNEMLWPQVARGLAIMFCFLPVTTVALSGLPLEQVHNASGLYNLMRNLGGALGLALFSTIIDRRFDLHYQHIAETVTINRSAVGAAAYALEGLDGTAPESALGLLAQIASREALVMAYNDLWLIMAAIMGGALLLMPLVRRVKVVDLGNPTGH